MILIDGATGAYVIQYGSPIANTVWFHNSTMELRKGTIKNKFHDFLLTGYTNVYKI